MKFTNRDYKPWPSVAWSIIEECNLKCPYCAAGMHQHQTHDRASMFDIRYVTKVVQQFKDLVEFELLGGEPTLHPLLPFIVDSLAALDNVVEVGVLTNALAYKKFPANKTFILATYHPYKNYLDRYLDNIKHYTDDGHRVTVTTTVQDEYKEEFERLKTFCDSANIEFEPTYVTVDNTTTLPEETLGPRLFQLDDKSYTLHEVISQGLNRFKGWNCSQRLLSMDCHCIIGTRCKGKLGRISADKLIPRPMVCNMDRCVLDEQIEEMKWI